MFRSMRIASIVALFAAASALPYAHADDERPFDDDQVVRFEIRTARDMQALFAMNLMPWSCKVGPGAPDFVLNPEHRTLVDRLGMRYHVLIDNVQDALDEDRQRNEAARQAWDEGGVAGDWTAWYTTYRTWPEVNARLDELVALRPDIAKKFIVGTSHENRTIYGLRIASPLNHEDDRRIVLLNGCQHAREWVSVMVPMFIADRLVREEGSDPQITQYLQQLEFIIVPIVNPDGYEFSYAHPNNRMWRKNRRHNGGSSYGVDLNRNWGVDWNGGQSTSTNTNSQVYVGPSVFSEPEVQAMRDLILAEDRIAAHIDFHSYTQLILQPLGYTNTPAADHGALNHLAFLMRQAIESVHGETYLHGTGGDLLYLASGIMPDWVYVLNGIFSYTIELRPKTANPGFLLPPEQIIPTSEESFAAILAMGQYVLDEMTPVPPCFGDLTGDGVVDGTDLLLLLGAWGPCLSGGQFAQPCTADLNEDGEVNGYDLLLLLAAWGDC